MPLLVIKILQLNCHIEHNKRGEAKKEIPEAFISSIEFVAKLLQALLAVACIVVSLAGSACHSFSEGRMNNK